jgi:hypothetical protein
MYTRISLKNERVAMTIITADAIFLQNFLDKATSVTDNSRLRLSACISGNINLL